MTATDLSLADAAPALTGVRLLLAEDEIVSRTLVAAVLERQGAIVTLAADGMEAVAAFRCGEFGAVLMDIEMPGLDGIAAARRIRGLEAIAGTRLRTPIIALTAHEFAADRDRCLQSGMDGYVTKPVRPARIVAEIRRLLPVPQVNTVSADPAASAPFDLAALREVAGGDDELAADVVRIFIEDAPTLMAAIDSAIAGDDRTALRETAHSLKGAAASLMAATVAASAAALEALALSAAPLVTARGLAVRIRDELVALDGCLRPFLAGSAAA